MCTTATTAAAVGLNVGWFFLLVGGRWKEKNFNHFVKSSLKIEIYSRCFDIISLVISHQILLFDRKEKEKEERARSDLSTSTPRVCTHIYIYTYLYSYSRK